jgi:hypothetical protein
MAMQFEFLSPADKPALLAVSTPEWQTMTKNALVELGYKVHVLESHAEFPARFSQIQYQVVVIEETFGGTSLGENVSLQMLQRLPMNQRRHATIILIGDSYGTLNALLAFQQSVHAVINYSEMALIAQLIQKVIADNNLFLITYREIERRVAQSRA